MTFGPLLKRLKNIITSPLAVGGLEISATSLKYLLVKNDTIVQASLRLPPGLMEKGSVKDRKNLVTALKSLHIQIAPLTKPLSVVLNLPSSLVFTQALSVPIVDKEHMQESIKLNLQMISPQKIEDSYYDWQEIKINKDLGQLDLLGAFSSKQPIDEFTSLLTEANFNCVAVEFAGLSLARLIRQRWSGLDLEEHYLLTYVSSEGLLLIILKNGNVYFNHFSPWQNAGAIPTSFTFDTIKDFLTQELQRVINFYIGRSGKQLSEAILISPLFNYEIVKLVSEHVGIKIRNLTIAELPKLQPNWFPVLGSGLRGVISRSKDTDITLTPTNTQTEYYQERTLTFIGLWRNIVIGSLVFIFAAAITVDTLLAKEESRLKTKLDVEFSVGDLKNSQALRDAIATFNHQLDFIERIASQEISWSSLTDMITQTRGDTVTIDRLLLDRTNGKGLITGKASSEQEAINFKNRLGQNPIFTELSLPLSALKPTPENTISFTLTFTLVLEPEKPTQ